MKGMGSTVPLHSTSSYPIPPEGEWDLFLCGFIFAIIIIIIIIFDVVVVVVVVKIPSFFKISQWNLGGHMGHGPNSL